MADLEIRSRNLGRSADAPFTIVDFSLIFGFPGTLGLGHKGLNTRRPTLVFYLDPKKPPIIWIGKPHRRYSVILER